MYVELSCKTNFSFLQGASHPEEYIEQAIQLGYKALGIADDNGVYGIPKAYWKAKDHPNFKLIVGTEVKVEGLGPLHFIAKTRAGYGLMCRLLTTAHADKEKGDAFLSKEELKLFAQDSRSNDWYVLAPLTGDYSFLTAVFPQQLFVKLDRKQDGFDDEKNHRARKLQSQYGLPVVSTNSVYYHGAERRRVQDVLTCIRAGTSLPEAGYEIFANSHRFLKSPDEMYNLYKDYPESVDNTVVIAENCGFSPGELRYRYPDEWIPCGHTAQSYLQDLVWQGAKKIYRGDPPQVVRKQIRHELQLIGQLKFADYFLTIWDIVQFAREREILCQGRGSAANSVVCYCLGITAIDPIQMNLLFERFISAERNEPPDIDVDFEHERREEVIQYIYKKYGRDRAAMVSAVTTYKRRSALREVSKALGIDVGTLSAKKLERDFSSLASGSPVKEAKEWADQLALEMRGFPRHLSIHSGGFTLSADPIIEIVPVEPARMEGRTIIQWDKYDLDYLGLLKVDILSLGMLSALKKTLALTNMQLTDIPQGDPPTYKMIQAGDTVGTFQVESRAQISMCGRMLPENFYDLVIQIAMIRPGPIVGGMVHPFLKRRRGLEAITYPHPRLEKILGKTMGVPLFQEQVMKIAIELAGFTPGEADELRRAIGAWRTTGSVEKMAQRLMDGLLNGGLPRPFAEQVFKQVQGFSQYGFPESHSASFALIAYASCYLKRHHTAEFMASVINSQPMGFYQNHTLIDDAKRHGVKVYPIDPNKSVWDCKSRRGEIRLGWRVVKGLRKKDAEQIIEQRPYFSLFDFLVKNSIRKDVLYRMAMGGVFDIFKEERRRTLWKLLNYQIRSTQTQLDLFAYQPHGMEKPDETKFKGLGDFETIRQDYNCFELSSIDHPMKALRREIHLPSNTSDMVKKLKGGVTVSIAGLLLVRQRPPTAKGVTFSTLEDEHGFLDLILHSETYEKYKDVFLNHCFVAVRGFVQRDLRAVSLLVKQVKAVFSEETGRERALNIEPTQYFHS